MLTESSLSLVFHVNSVPYIFALYGITVTNTYAEKNVHRVEKKCQRKISMKDDEKKLPDIH